MKYANIPPPKEVASPACSAAVPFGGGRSPRSIAAARHAVSAGHSVEELADTRSTHGSGAAVASEPVTKPMLGAHTNMIMQNVQIGHSTAMNGLRRPHRVRHASVIAPMMKPVKRSTDLAAAIAIACVPGGMPSLSTHTTVRAGRSVKSKVESGTRKKEYATVGRQRSGRSDFWPDFGMV